MMIYTSYYGNLNFIHDELVPISISLYTPSNWIGPCYRELAPDPLMFKEYKITGDKDLYIRRFYNMLYRLNPHDVVNTLKIMTSGRSPVLLCYEPPGKFCHRQLVANWFNSNGIPCVEYDYNKYLKRIM